MKLNPTLNMKDKIYYPRFHRVIKCFAVEVCEGEGTKENPMSLVFYVHDEQGNLLGKIDELGIISPLPQPKND